MMTQDFALKVMEDFSHCVSPATADLSFQVSAIRAGRCASDMDRKSIIDHSSSFSDPHASDQAFSVVAAGGEMPETRMKDVETSDDRHVISDE